MQENERETIEKVSGLEKKLIQTSKEVELLKVRVPLPAHLHLKESSPFTLNHSRKIIITTRKLTETRLDSDWTKLRDQNVDMTELTAAH